MALLSIDSYIDALRVRTRLGSENDKETNDDTPNYFDCYIATSVCGAGFTIAPREMH